MRKLVLFVTSVIFLSLFSLMLVVDDSNVPDPTAVESIKVSNILYVSWDSDQSSGRFLNICLQDYLDRFDYYPYEITVTTLDSSSFEGTGILHPTLKSNRQSCFKENIYQYSTRHHNIHSVLQSHFYKGNVKRLRLTVWKSKNKQSIYESIEIENFWWSKVSIELMWVLISENYSICLKKLTICLVQVIFPQNCNMIYRSYLFRGLYY